jgi:hypothetical protein
LNPTAWSNTRRPRGFPWFLQAAREEFNVFLTIRARVFLREVLGQGIIVIVDQFNQRAPQLERISGSTTTLKGSARIGLGDSSSVPFGPWRPTDNRGVLPWDFPAVSRGKPGRGGHSCGLAGLFVKSESPGN